MRFLLAHGHDRNDSTVCLVTLTPRAAREIMATLNHFDGIQAPRQARPPVHIGVSVPEDMCVWFRSQTASVRASGNRGVVRLGDAEQPQIQRQAEVTRCTAIVSRSGVRFHAVVCDAGGASRVVETAEIHRHVVRDAARRTAIRFGSGLLAG